MTGRLEIFLPVFKEDRTRAGEEGLEVEELGPNHYRLVYSPGLVEGLAAGDEFAVFKDEPLGYRILKRSGNFCVWFFFSKEASNRGADGDLVRQRVEAIGGRCDGGMRYVLVFTIPLSVGFTAIETLFNQLVTEFEGATWFYGNVYDPLDGETPLRWWEIF
jgi:Domain of unknown function (DUF4265)